MEWVNHTKAFEYYADKEFFGTHYIVLFWHRFRLPNIKCQ